LVLVFRPHIEKGCLWPGRLTILHIHSTEVEEKGVTHSLHSMEAEFLQ